jgi:nucleolar protein 56
MKELRKSNLKQTKKDIELATTRDNLIIQTIHSIDEISKCLNALATNLKERYGIYAPSLLKTKDLQELLDQAKDVKREEMGIKLNIKDLNSIKAQYNQTVEIQKLKNKQEKYLESVMEEIVPSTLKITGSVIGARLIEKAGSLKRLARLPSSTIQILGAEKALFRHLQSNARPPKFGIIFAHESISSSKGKGKAARQLAAKISISVRKDYFR